MTLSHHLRRITCFKASTKKLKLIMATTTLPPDSSDIKKMGFLVKLKTNKKKLFVLRDKSGLGPARLEYYDSEKKLRSGQLKRTIVLSTCFNINKKAQPGADGSGRSASGGAGRHAIVLFTKDDCFTVGCESEAEQTEWLTCLTELRNANLDESTLRAPLFEHIWSVSVKAKELGSDKKLIIPGQYRLCLTNNNLSLIRINEDLGTIVPIDYIKRVGHSQHFVFLELGRSAVTGPGNLWLQVEDAVIAQNIHSAVLSCMNLIQQQPQTSIFRGRSHTSAVTGKEREKQRRSRGLADSGTGITTGRPRRALTIHGGQSSLSALAQARQNIESKQQTSQRRSTERRSMLDATFDQRDLRPTSPSGSVHLLSPEVPLEEEESDYLQHDPAVEDNTNPNAYMLRSSPTCIYNRLGSKLDATDGSGRISSNDPKLMGDTILTSHTASYTQSSTTAVTSSNSGTYLNMDSLRSAGVELPGVSQDKNRTSCVVGDSYMEMSHRNVTTSTGRTTTSSVTSGGTGSLRSSVQGLTGSSISQTVVIGQHSGPSQIGSHDLLDNKQSVVSGITSDKDSYMMMSAPTETRCIVTCGDKEPPPGSGDSQEPRGCEIVGTEQKEVDEYVSMSAPSNEGYLPMSIKRANDDVSHDSNSSVSSVISSADSSVNEQGSEVPFRSLSRLPEISGDAGYIEMSSPLQEICPRPRLDTVHSYLREDDSHMLAEFPIRAYSVGSKPTNQNYVDMTGGKGKVRERSLMIGPDRSNTEKSSSAPHLNDGSSPHSSLSSPQQNSPGGDSDDHVMKRPPIRPISIVQPPADTIDDRFMELDFNRRESSHDETLEPPRNRSSSGGSKDLRMKAFSFSGARDAFARLSLFRKGSGSSSGSSQASQKNSTLLNPSTAQPRTTSRNRTESFGLSNPPRPRAATEGHRSMLGGALDEWVSRRGSGTKMREDADGVGRSFNEHVPATNLGYMDMTVSSTSAQSSDGYMEMKAQPSSVYMDMKVGESVTTSCSEKGSASSSIALCKTEAKTLDARVDQQETSDYMECNPSDCDSNAHCKTAGKTSQVMTTKAKESAYMDMQPSAAGSGGLVCGTTRKDQDRVSPQTVMSGSIRNSLFFQNTDSYCVVDPSVRDTSGSLNCCTSSVSQSCHSTANDKVSNLSDRSSTGLLGVSLGSMACNSTSSYMDMNPDHTTRAGANTTTTFSTAPYMSMTPGGVCSKTERQLAAHSNVEQSKNVKDNAQSCSTVTDVSKYVIVTSMGQSHSDVIYSGGNSIKQSSDSERSGGPDFSGLSCNAGQQQDMQLMYASLDLTSEATQRLAPLPHLRPHAGEHVYSEIDFEKTGKEKNSLS